jgi:hypothetical protein
MSHLDGFGSGPNFLAFMIAPEHVYVLPDVDGVTLWCGFCCKPMLERPIAAALTLLMHYADDHRNNVCTNPLGPNVDTWAPPTPLLAVRSA